MKKTLMLLIAFLFCHIDNGLAMFSAEKTLSNIFQDSQDSAVRDKFKNCFDRESAAVCDFSGIIADIAENESLKKEFFTQIVKNVIGALERSGGTLINPIYGTQLTLPTLTAFISIFKIFRETKASSFDKIKELQIQATIPAGKEWSAKPEWEYETSLIIEQSFEKWLEFLVYYINKVLEYNAYEAVKSKKFIYLSPTFVAKKLEEVGPLLKLKEALSELKLKLGTMKNKLATLKGNL